MGTNSLKTYFILIFLIAHSAIFGQDYYSYKDVIQGDQPERKWQYGGFGSFGFGDDLLVVELGPEAFYKVSDFVHFGAGPSLLYVGRQYAYQGGNRKTQSVSWGGRVFGRIKTIKKIHLRVEYEQLNVEYLPPVSNADFQRIWKDGLHLGVEFFKDDFIGQSSFAGFYYNVLFEKDISPQFSAFGFRAGVYF